jgi:hypothetical protein
VSAWGDGGGDLIEVMLHALGVGALHDDGGSGLALWTDGPEQIGAAGAQIGDLPGSRALGRPDAGSLGLLADPPASC